MQNTAAAIKRAWNLLVWTRPTWFLLWAMLVPQGQGWAWGVDLAANVAWVGGGVAVALRLRKQGIAFVPAARNYCWFLLGWTVLEWYGLGFWTTLGDTGPTHSSYFTGQAAANMAVAICTLAVLSPVEAPKPPGSGNIW